MEWCTLAKCLFVGLFLIPLAPSTLGGKRKPNIGFAGIRDCLTHWGCECGGDAEINFFSDCSEEVGNKSVEMALSWFNSDDVCPDIEETFEHDPKQIIELLCSVDADVRDMCLSNGNAVLKEYHTKLRLSLDPEDQAEAEKLQNGIECMFPAFTRCNQYPNSCM